MKTRSNLTRVLLVAGVLVVALAFCPALESSGGGGAAEDGLGLLGVTTAQAQTVWSVSRRTARRTTRRVGRRQAYIYGLPAGYQTQVVGGATYYVSSGTYYKPVMVEGRTAYVVTEAP